MKIIKNLNQQLQRLEVNAFEIDNPIIFQYFGKLKETERDEQFFRALYIGTLALMEDRLSTFFAKTSNELGTQLESLKLIFDMKKELFFKTATKGLIEENAIAQVLDEYLKSKNIKDTVALTGTIPGSIPKNKTGDILCSLEDKPDIKITIECKFDKHIKLGDISNKDIFSNKTDTAWSQLLEALVNRDAKVSIIVLDRSLIDATILKFTENVAFIPNVGFIAIIDTNKGYYDNLFIAYLLARDIAINAKQKKYDLNLLSMLINRIIKAMEEIMSIKKLVEDNIKNNKKILEQLHKSMLFIEFNKTYFDKFLQQGDLTRQDLFAFYNADDINDKFKLIEKEIKDLD